MKTVVRDTRAEAWSPRVPECLPVHSSEPGDLGMVKTVTEAANPPGFEINARCKT